MKRLSEYFKSFLKKDLDPALLQVCETRVEFIWGSICNVCSVSATFASLIIVVSYVYVIIDKDTGQISCLQSGDEQKRI